MDYWGAVPTNMPAKMYRWNSPGLSAYRDARPAAVLEKLDSKLSTSNFSVRYFHRDRTQPWARTVRAQAFMHDVVELGTLCMRFPLVG